MMKPARITIRMMASKAIRISRTHHLFFDLSGISAALIGSAGGGSGRRPCSPLSKSTPLGAAHSGMACPGPLADAPFSLSGTASLAAAQTGMACSGSGVEGGRASFSGTASLPAAQSGTTGAVSEVEAVRSVSATDSPGAFRSGAAGVPSDGSSMSARSSAVKGLTEGGGTGWFFNISSRSLASSSSGSRRSTRSRQSLCWRMSGTVKLINHHARAEEGLPFRYSTSSAWASSCFPMRRSLSIRSKTSAVG